MANTEPYPLYCADCGARIPPHVDHCEHCYPDQADTTVWPVRGLLALCGLYFFVVLWRTVIL